MINNDKYILGEINTLVKKENKLKLTIKYKESLLIIVL